MIQIPKQTIDYCQHLRLILSCANSVMFIDPYLDPSQSQYGEFYHLLNLVKQPYARIELHSAVKGQDQSNMYRSTLDLQDWIKRFSILYPILKAKNLVAEVFIWQDFDPDDQKIHDRYILTDLVGISMTSGFNIQANAEVTWSRQTKKIYEKTQNDFHPNAGTYTLKYNFMIPKE
ncbi:hypothetical protein PROH_07095 [Prochlorothrix hollandica PCC 9006 = CALU 1027]|uniref:Uncharacterized protein n=2 Tax=Prochlorothrix hollandica TaxID=1223 RepID=A0A0M2PU54_PROHO|nr:hypothetical protein PROH_07095 [Prochlorothrix hollandica PCC 9006 = CALU 1027]